MITQLWLKGLIRSRSGRLLGAIIGVAITVALLASISAFTVSSAASMTPRAITSIPVDWQILLSPNTDSNLVIGTIKKSTPYKAIEKVGYAESTGFTANTNNTIQTTGSGKVLGISPQYRLNFPTQIRLLIGSLDGVLVAQQTAANLQITIGSPVLIQRLGLPPVTVKVDGIIDLPYADSLFQSIGVSAGTTQAPPDNIILLPSEQWYSIFAPQATLRPDSVRSELHLSLNHNFPDDPSTAYTYVEQLAKNLEASITGSGIVGNNLAARLNTVRSDALYAKILFLLLGLPGVILSILLTLAVTNAGKSRRQQEQSLLRIRGANTAQILQLESVEALLVAIVGTVMGVILALLATSSIIPFDRLIEANTLLSIGIAASIGFIVALIAVLYPAWYQVHHLTVIETRAIIGNRIKPLWQQVYLDLFFLSLSALTFWQTANRGYQIILAPEGVPQTSVSYESLIAPVCFWLGTGLLAIRLWERFLHRGSHIFTNIFKPVFGSLSGLFVASLSRQRVMITQGIVLVALSVSFAISTAVFNTTYNVQAQIDAELTNGSDIQVTIPSSKGGIPIPLQKSLASLSGVISSQPIQHRFAYVGKDLQDLYGIDPKSITKVTHLRDAYFVGGNAQKTLDSLTATPDGLLVSEETVKDYQLKKGDLINLRLQSAQDNQYNVIPFHFLEIVKEFPTAPKDSFLVANAEYIAQQTYNKGAEIFLIRTNNTDLATKVRELVKSLSRVKVTDIGSTEQIIGSSLTNVDLHGLTGLELSFALLLLTGATGLIMALGMAQRRRNFAILTALGAKKNQLAALRWSEGLVILLGGSATGILIGFSLAQMLVKVLTGVFDPPAEALSIPWSYLVVLFITASVSTGVAVYITQRASSRVGVEILRDI